MVNTLTIGGRDWAYEPVHWPDGAAWWQDGCRPVDDIRRAHLGFRAATGERPGHLYLPTREARWIADHRQILDIVGITRMPAASGWPRILGMEPHVEDLPHLSMPCVSRDPYPAQGATDMVTPGFLPPCRCGGRFAVVEDLMRARFMVSHTDAAGNVAERYIDFQAFYAAGNTAIAADIAELCPGYSAPPRATGGIVTPGSFALVGEPGPEMYTFPDGTVRYNRQALEGHALNYSLSLVWSECPCGGLVHRERDAPAALDNFVHLDTRAEIRHGQITDLQMARARMTPDQVRCPLAFLAAAGPLGPPDGPAAPEPRFACAVEYPDGARAVSVVPAADRPAVEAALASLAAAGVRFTLTPEGAP